MTGHQPDDAAPRHTHQPAAPVRRYFGREDLAGWACRAALMNVTVFPTGLYGWRLYGEVPARPGSGP